jgi:hypothetical protein
MHRSHPPCPALPARRLAALLAATLLASAAAQAATPESGRIDDANPTAEWDGGPFLVPNVSNIIQLDSAVEDVIAENSICEEATGQTCDVYRFEVALTGPIDEEDDILQITVSWQDDFSGDEAVANLPDYDLELYNEDTGELVKQQATGDNPEILTTALANGRYRLVVIPYAPMDVPYHGVVTHTSYDEMNKSLFAGGALGAGALAALFLALAATRGRRRP